MKKLIIVLFLTCLSVSLTSEDNENLSKYIGGAFGISTGYGLSYRYWPGDLGGQVVFSPFTDGNEYRFNLGLGGVKTLYETKFTRLFLYVATNGTLAHYDEDSYTDYEYDTDDNIIEGSEHTVTEEAYTNLGMTVGIGPGIEIYIFKNIVLDIMFGYAYSIGETISWNNGFGFTFETALYYRF